MENVQNVKLIEGIFSPQDSKEIFMSVFLSKIQFHEMRNFSSQELYGKEDEIAKIKIPQLRESLDKLMERIESAKKEKKQLKINSEIQITFVD